jgi:two-component system, chemotaxis family, protein-glutamate methylesterase/glutaminase
MGYSLEYFEAAAGAYPGNICGDVRRLRKDNSFSSGGENMPGHDIIVIGASAGGVEALVTITGALPPALPAAVFVVLHIPAHGPSLLANILSRSGPLKAVHPMDGEEIEHSCIYVAPPDQHLLVEEGKVRLVHGPRENRHRPAVDPLFRSAAQAYGPRVVGVILTGALDDGTAGLLAVKRRGGIAVVQHPQEALYSGMPLSALRNVRVDHTLPLASIGVLLRKLADEEAKEEGSYPGDMEKETSIVEMDLSLMHDSERVGVGAPSAFSCPGCGGVLWEIQDGAMQRFRCRVGHAYTMESMLAEQSETLENALWAALKTLQESADLSHRMAQQARDRGQQWAAQCFEARLHNVKQRMTLIRQALMKGEVELEGNSFGGDSNQTTETGPG